MSKAIKVTRCDDEEPPLRVKVATDDGGESMYVRLGPAPQPEGDADFKYEEINRDRIYLGAKNGETLLQQEKDGLPSRATMSVNPFQKGDSVAHATAGVPLDDVWRGSVLKFYQMEKE